ncbi:hypothetical protein OSTOST_03576 [Ostertagia ostertagi]
MPRPAAGRDGEHPCRRARAPRLCTDRIPRRHAHARRTPITNVIQLICRNLGWEWGAYWGMETDGSGRLRCRHSWHAADGELETFSRISAALSLSAGEGLVGRVWQTGEAEWVEDMSTDPRFLRRGGAQACGPLVGLCIPGHLRVRKRRAPPPGRPRVLQQPHAPAGGAAAQSLGHHRRADRADGTTAGDRSRHPPPGPGGRDDRTGQPRVLLRAAEPALRAESSPGSALRAGVYRPGPLQADQRCLRPRSGQCRAAGVRPPPACAGSAAGAVSPSMRARAAT